ncbi:MAG: hypothetical protein WC992_03470 [Acholeplasmataceae bacterium]
MNIKADKMRYQTNKLGYALILLGLAFSVVALFRIITPTQIIPNHLIALEIVINIILLLLTFLTAERCKIYQKNWAIVSLVIASIHLLRILFVPRNLLSKGQLTLSQFSWIMIFLIITATCIALGGYVTLAKHHILAKHLKEIGE